jgi:hypothetical protein
MKEFFAAKPEAGAGESSRKIAIETVENNIKFIRVKILLNFFFVFREVFLSTQ